MLVSARWPSPAKRTAPMRSSDLSLPLNQLAPGAHLLLGAPTRHRRGNRRADRFDPASQAIEQVDAIIRGMSLIATMVAVTVDQQNSAIEAEGPEAEVRQFLSDVRAA